MFRKISEQTACKLLAVILKTKKGLKVGAFTIYPVNFYILVWFKRIA